MTDRQRARAAVSPPPPAPDPAAADFDRTLPLLYFAFAHVSLLVALAVIAVDPRGVSGFFYHPRMLGVVHLVTLGWMHGSWSAQAMMAYGVLGLLGFLGQLVVAMELWLLPMLAWRTASTGPPGSPPPVSARHLPAARVAWLACAGWAVGVPALAGGLALDRVPLVAAGAWVLLGAVALNTGHAVWLLRPGSAAPITPPGWPPPGR